MRLYIGAFWGSVADLTVQPGPAMRAVGDQRGIAMLAGVVLAKRALAIAALVLLASIDAEAKLCGDDVNGLDVPCACGDVVASDVRLDDDPVASSICPNDGLIVRVAEGEEPITIDLAGRVLRGSDVGTGLWIVRGGTGGARVVSTLGTATIEGFRDGLVAQGANSVALVEGVSARASARIGIRLVEVQGAEVRDTSAIDSGGDGFFVSGRGYRLVDTRSVRSARHGYHLMGSDGIVGEPGGGNVAEDSGDIGFSAMGMGHRFVECVASGSGRHGLQLHGAHYEVTGCRARGNGRDGLRGRAMVWHVAGNVAVDNDNNGLVIMGSDVSDDGGNLGHGNRGLHQRLPVVQCEIAAQPCRP